MQIPEREQQIVQSHAAFICEAVACLQNADLRPRLDELLQTAQDNGWQALSAAVREIAGGQRDATLLGGLDEEDRAIAGAILRGLQDASTLPDPARKADPALAAPGLAHMIHAAGRGDAQALSLIGQMAEQMSRVGGDMSRVAGVIRPLINGERDADRLCQRMDARGRQLVLQILDELGKLGRH